MGRRVYVTLNAFARDEDLQALPQLLEHHALRWILPAEIPQYDFCPADQEILAKLRRERG